MAEKKVKGRKRHIVVDTQGNLLYIKVHAANVHDTVAGCTVFNNALAKHITLEGVCADAGYKGTFVDYVTDELHKKVEISERISEKWQVLPKRWVVERTLSWFNSYRCLSKDYEITTDAAETDVYIAHSMVLLRRLANS